MVGTFEVIYSPVFLEHRPENYHPENPDRLLRAIKALPRSSGAT